MHTAAQPQECDNYTTLVARVQELDELDTVAECAERFATESRLPPSRERQEFRELLCDALDVALRKEGPVTPEISAPRRIRIILETVQMRCGRVLEYLGA